MRPVDTFLMEIDQEAATTRRVLERVPNDKLSWKPHPKSMSLGQLALHIAMIPGRIAQMISQDTFESSGFTQPEAKSAHEVIATHDESVTKAKDYLKTLDDQRLGATWRLTRDGREILAMPRVAVVRTVMLNHWYHHRGQLSVYLRLFDVPLPSIYGPSADENPFARQS